MKPWELLGETRTPEGSDVRLTRQDNEYVILVDGKTLMSSRRHGSEDALAALACPHLRSPEEPHVLVGGLGMGFTLRATLDLLPPDATVTVVELLPAVVEWNRGPLGALAGYPLKDQRVRIEIDDVGRGAAGVGTGTIRWHPPRRRQRAGGVHGVRQPGVIRQRRGERRVRGTRDGRCAGRVVGPRRSEVRTAPPLPRVRCAGHTGCVPD